VQSSFTLTGSGSYTGTSASFSSMPGNATTGETQTFDTTEGGYSTNVDEDGEYTTADEGVTDEYTAGDTATDDEGYSTVEGGDTLDTDDDHYGEGGGGGGIPGILGSGSSCTTEPASPSRRHASRKTAAAAPTTPNSELQTPRSNMTTPRATNNSSSSHHHTPRSRVPGGAAAKIMLVGPKGSNEDGTTSSKEEVAVLEPVWSQGSTQEDDAAMDNDAINTSIGEDLQKAKEAFSKGSPPRNNRLTTPHDNNDTAFSVVSDANTSATASTTTPSFLNRSEIFHRTAAAAIAALLTPAAERAQPGNVFFPDSMSPRTLPGESSSKTAETTPSAANSAMTPSSKSVTSLSLLSKETEKRLEEIEARMISPTNTLTELLTAIATPDEEVEDLMGYAVRRKNACGALQTLTTDPQNRVRICWTVGVLPALTSVLKEGLLDHDPERDPRIQTEYEAARNRTISALMNMAMVVKNRLAIFHCPNLVHNVLTTIQQDEGNARRGCCAIMGFLAKSPENRLLMAQLPGLSDTVVEVLKPRAPPEEEEEKQSSPVKYPWNSDPDDDDDNSTDSEDHSGRRKKSSKKKKSDKDPSSSSASSAESGGQASLEFKKQVAAAAGDAGSPRGLSKYDDTADEMLQGARQNLFAMMGHLVKEKDNAYHFARQMNLVSTLVEITRYQESPSHALAIKVLAHLTRHRLNKGLAFKPKTVVPALVEATQSPSDDARLYACYALQNLSQEKSCRQELAIAAHLIEVLCDRCRNGKQEAERLAAISTLKNLCDEPANLIPMTNTTGCVSTLMHFAHPAEQDKHVTELMQYRACDALATLSHWLRKIATSGNSLDRTQQGRAPIKGLFVPSLREVSWNQWH